MHNRRRTNAKPATSKAFIDHCPYQVVGLTDDRALPANWPELARTFTVFHDEQSAKDVALLRKSLNQTTEFAVVDRNTGEILHNTWNLL